MSITTPKNIMEMAANSDGGKLYFESIKRNAAFYIGSLHMEPTEEDYQEATEVLSDHAGIELPVAQVKTILSLYPKVRIQIAEWGADDTATRGEILSAVSDLYLGCEWPTYGDKIDISAFTELLKAQIEAVDKMTVAANPIAEGAAQ